VRGVSGNFQQGDAVLVLGPSGERLAQGLSAYDSADAARLAGHRSDEFEALLGWRGRDELIHRDDLVLFQPTR
jgi:glutamate 5-kinase